MSDTVLLLAGTGVFALTTVTTLLYGYFRFAAVYRQDQDPDHEPVDIRDVAREKGFRTEPTRR